MKKVVFIYTGSSSKGGLAKYLTLLYKNFPKDKISLGLCSVGRQEVAAEIQKAGGHVDFVSGFWGLVNRIRQERPEVIITAGVKSNLYGRLASFFSSVKVVTMMHSDFEFDYRGFKRTIFRFLDRIIRFRTARYIVVSEYLQSQLVGAGIPKAKITVIYNGIEPIKIKSRVKEAGIMIGSVGRLHTVKNFENLIKAVQNFKKPEVSLRIWGNGPEENALKNLIEESKNICLETSPVKIEEIFSQLDLYVQPSFSEGFGLALVEAMSTGLPVVVAPGGALVEIVRDGKTGIVAGGFEAKDLSEAIFTMLKDPEKMAKMALDGQKEVLEKYSIENWVKALEAELIAV